MGRISHHSINYLWNVGYLCQQALLTVALKNIFDAWDIRLSQFSINYLWYLVSINRLSQYHMNCLWYLGYLSTGSFKTAWIMKSVNLYQQGLTIHDNLWYLISVRRLSQYSMIYDIWKICINRLSRYNMNYVTCVNMLSIHYNLWYLISVNRLSQYSINYHWYLKSVNRHSQYSRQLHSQKWAWSGQHSQCGRDNDRQWDPRPGIRPRDVTGGRKLPGGGGRSVMSLWLFIRLNLCLYFA